MSTIGQNKREGQAMDLLLSDHERALELIKRILANDIDYPHQTLKLGAIWDVCDRAARYHRTMNEDGGAEVEVLAKLVGVRTSRPITDINK